MPTKAIKLNGNQKVNSISKRLSLSKTLKYKITENNNSKNHNSF